MAPGVFRCIRGRLKNTQGDVERRCRSLVVSALIRLPGFKAVVTMAGQIHHG